MSNILGTRKVKDKLNSKSNPAQTCMHCHDSIRPHALCYTFDRLDAIRSPKRTAIHLSLNSPAVSCSVTSFAEFYATKHFIGPVIIELKFDEDNIFVISTPLFNSILPPPRRKVMG